MKYWDASALLPLVIEEPTSQAMESILRDDPAIVTWWATRVECTSAIARLERDGALSPGDTRRALARLRDAAASWIEVPAHDDLHDHAERLLRVHALRAADALQLAAALVATDFAPRTVGFVSLDARLTTAAEREGFTIEP